MGMAVLDKPGHRVGSDRGPVLTNIRSRGHAAGFLAADRAYSSSKPDDFQLPALALGYQPVYDYKIDQLGVRGESGGFLEIEGAYYCPAIPKKLIDATLDFREKQIDKAAFAGCLEERWKYHARQKGQPDPEGHMRLQCPAASRPLARCELKPKSITLDTQGRLHIHVHADLAASPPPSCTQESVMVPPSAGAKFRQPLLFGSAEWKKTYNSIRNTNEGMNGFVKDSAFEALGDPLRRRIHGRAAQTVLVALQLMAANVRKIRKFRFDVRLEKPGKRPRPRRRRSTSIEAWRPKSPGIRPTTDPDPPPVV